jgi:hypothetical protein
MAALLAQLAHKMLGMGWAVSQVPGLRERYKATRDLLNDIGWQEEEPICLCYPTGSRLVLVKNKACPIHGEAKG